MHLRTTTGLFLAAALLGSALMAGCAGTGGSGWESAPLSGEVKALEGMRARHLDSEMNRLGFTSAGGYKTDDASITLWWNPRGQQCVRVETRDGRAASIESVSAGHCR
jgi:outer membrane murein-binding lipoprotein Lpp